MAGFHNWVGTSAHFLRAWQLIRQILQGIRLVNRSVKYRQIAYECYEAARILSEPREKAKMLAMAQSWILLADHAERNSHLAQMRDAFIGFQRHLYEG